MKQSFLLYKDFSEQLFDLTDKQVGQYLKAIYSFQLGIDYEVTDPIVKFALKGAISQFKRDEHKYKDKVAKCSEAGRKSAERRSTSVNKRKQQSTDPTVVEEVEVEEEENKLLLSEFEYCWKSYGRKGTKASALNYWKKHKQEDRDAIKAKIPAYVSSTPELKYRKDFSGWINPTNRIWENEIVGDSQQATEQQSGAPVYTTAKDFLNGK
jgi:hypothetical protein